MYKNEHDANVRGFHCAPCKKVGTTPHRAKRSFANKVALFVAVVGSFFFFAGLMHILKDKQSFDLSCVLLGGAFWGVAILIGVSK